MNETTASGRVGAKGGTAEGVAEPRPIGHADPDSRARTHLANERTFLAWIRTSLGFLAGGAAIAAVSTIVGQMSLELKLASLLLLAALVGAYHVGRRPRER